MGDWKILILVSILTVFLSWCGCNEKAVERVGEGKDTSLTRFITTKLDSKLVELLKASEPKVFADNNGIDYSEGKVRVVVELESGRDLGIPEYEVYLENRHADLLQMLIPIEELRSLTIRPEVKFVRLPMKPRPMKQN